MIEQRYIDILKKEKEDLLWRKESLNFFQKLFYKKYTDWIVTDEVKVYSLQQYVTDGLSFKDPVGKPRNITKQLEIRMRLKDGKIEINEFEI